MFSLDGLNDQQREAAETIKGPVLILAGAGSGKTRTVTYRIANMVTNLGIDPKSILGVSFTTKAAKEMKERVEDLLGKKSAKGITLTTFHSLAVRILRNEIDLVGMKRSFNIYDTGDQTSIVKEALRQFRYDDGQSFDQKRILGKIGFLKNSGISESQFESSKFFDPDDKYDHAIEFVYRYYQTKLKFCNAIDFDDILFLTATIFKEHPEIAKKYSNIYKYIMIDEYQDTNPLQFSIVLGLTSTHHNLCVVGDDDQAIYSFRGADSTNILNFEKNYPNSKVIKLEENYRSTNSILALANNVIKENKKRKDKTLRGQFNGVIPELWSTANGDHEAQIVVDQIAKHQMDGKSLKDIAVLYRGANQAPLLEDQLRQSQIPYTIIGGQKFYDKKEIKDLMAYLFLIHNPYDEISLRRILNVPNRGIGLATLNTFLDIAKENNCSLFKALILSPNSSPTGGDKIITFTNLIQNFSKKFKSGNLASSISDLIQELHFMNYIEKIYKHNPKQWAQKKQDIISFIDAAERFTGYSNSDGSLQSFIERLLLQDSQDNNKDLDIEDEEGTPNQVTLMTLHSSKGLEYDNIFLVGTEEEILPHKKTIKENGDISEERRLFYVGITRAKKRLIMTYCKERKIFGRNVPRDKTRFLLSVPKSIYKEADCTTFGHLSDSEADEYKTSFFSNLIDSL